MIFVFGSNTAGRHAAGAARFAVVKHKAEMGVAEGETGNAYAIPTCDRNINPLPFEKVKEGVERFIAFARQNPRMKFQVTRIGCGIAGFKDEEIGPLFAKAPANCAMPPEWQDLCPNHDAWEQQ